MAAGKEILVVGGGTMGLTTAIELRRRGWEVTLLDAGTIPTEVSASTDLNKFVRCDYGSNDFYMDMGEAAMEGWRRWNREWRREVYHEEGWLLLKGGEMKAGSFEQESLKRLRARGYAPELITPSVLRSKFPHWAADNYPHGYFNPIAGWVEAGNIVALLQEEAVRVGVRIRSNTRVKQVLYAGDSSVRGVLLGDDTILHTRTLLVTAGANTPTILPQVRSIMWASGQPIFHFAPSRPQEFISQAGFPGWAADMSETGWYGFGAVDGLIKIGHHGPGVRFETLSPSSQLRVPKSAERDVRRFLARSIPALAEAPLAGAKLCLYCDTFDSNFLIDHDPAHAGLIVAAGDSGHGLKFAPLFGELIADVIEKKSNRWTKDNVFAWRTPTGVRSKTAERCSDNTSISVPTTEAELLEALARDGALPATGKFVPKLKAAL